MRDYSNSMFCNDEAKKNEDSLGNESDFEFKSDTEINF